MSERNANVPSDQRITFRVGINLGDIIIDADDIHGTANIAARLEAMAEPERLRIVRRMEHVRGKVSFERTISASTH